MGKTHAVLFQDCQDCGHVICGRVPKLSRRQKWSSASMLFGVSDTSSHNDAQNAQQKRQLLITNSIRLTFRDSDCDSVPLRIFELTQCIDILPLPASTHQKRSVPTSQLQVQKNRSSIHRSALRLRRTQPEQESSSSRQLDSCDTTVPWRLALGVNSQSGPYLLQLRGR